MAVVILDKALAFVFMKVFFENTLSGESGGTINYVIKEKNNLDFLILGPSRAKHGIDPSVLTALGTNGHNLGINATAMLNSMLVLDILVNHGVTTKVLVLQTDASDYASSTDKNLLDQIKRLYPYDTEKVREYVKRAGPLEQTLYFFDLYKLNRKALNIGFNFLKRNSLGDYSGYVGLPSSSLPLDDKSVVQDLVYDPSSLNREALRVVQKICEEHGITLIVVFPPSYKNVFYNEKEQGRLINDMKKDGIKNIIDLADVGKIKGLNNKEYWRDAIHLNSNGAQVFSAALNKELQKISR